MQRVEHTVHGEIESNDYVGAEKFQVAIDEGGRNTQRQPFKEWLDDVIWRFYLRGSLSAEVQDGREDIPERTS